MSTLHDLSAQGQSIWLDFISRSFLRGGRLATLQAFLIHGLVADTAELGIDLRAVTDKLLIEGLAAFEAPFRALITSIAAKQTRGETPETT